MSDPLALALELILREEGLAEGRAIGIVDGMRRILLIYGRHRLGDPNGETLAVIEAAPSELIEQWADVIDVVASWSDLVKA